MGRRTTPSRCLTDYGLVDEFVGCRQGGHPRHRSARPQAIDLTHNIRPFDVRAGSTRSGSMRVVHPSGGRARGGRSRGRQPAASRSPIEVADGEAVLRRPRQRIAGTGGHDGGRRRTRGAVNHEQYELQRTVSRSPATTCSPRRSCHLCNGVDLAEARSSRSIPTNCYQGMVTLPRRGRSLEGLVGRGPVGRPLWQRQLNMGPDDVDRLGRSWPGSSGGDEVRHGQPSSRPTTRSGPAPSASSSTRTGCCAVSSMRRSAADELGLAPGTEIRLSPAVWAGPEVGWMAG